MKKLSAVMLPLALAACGGASPSDDPTSEQVGSLPLTIIEPANNPSSAEKVALGKQLFWDPILSGNQDVACATCHHPDSGYAEHIDVSMGVGGVGLSEARISGALVKRNSPTIVNTAYNGIDENSNYDPSATVMFWDNRATSLEDQALDPIRSKEEMRGDQFSEAEILDEVVSRLNANGDYMTLFTDAFGDSTINDERIAQALAAFERSLISANSPFDRYARGDESALTQQQVRGLNAFIDAGCNACHSGPMFSDYALHQLTVETNPKLTNAGIEDKGVDGKFRTPSLRNVALTAPYMHNGTERTLRDAIAFYNGVGNPSNDPDLAALDFDNNGDTIDAIEAFLMSLTDEGFDKTIPDAVPSGLNPGGDI
ncbi:cytochrome C peroxidase [Enterovibrio norvegicus]|uniref:cytochrome-c peroxidase n=1 Tax=Enterovibrio norvegicus TaxID=188144 RepID=UPI0002D8F235|nr:cytochrome c peroxidase [Enterovibrio norvegicus]OEE57846.1 cytochrome C peroxidase [Enterovibrio norvegicus]